MCSGGGTGVLSLSRSGRGVRMVNQERLDVIPVRRVKRVLEEKKKEAVFRMK